MKVTPKRLTDARLNGLLKVSRTAEEVIPDAGLAGLAIRLGRQQASASWTLIVRVTGEGGVNTHGKPILGKRHRVNLGSYPAVTVQRAHAMAAELLEQAKKGINPKVAMAEAATSGSLTVEALGKVFLEQYVVSKELDCANKYALAFSTHINPKVGPILAELLTREAVREVMTAARVKRKRSNAGRGGPMIGGVEAARTAVGVLRHMYSWAMEEGKVKRKDNPASNIQKNLPKKKEGEVVLSLREARIVWAAAQLTGYPFGTHAQLMLLTGCRLDELASAEAHWIDLEEGLIVVPADSYKSDHVHVVPLVPQAIRLLKNMPKPTSGKFFFSSTRGRVPIKGIAKYFKTRLADAVIAINGEPLPKRITSHVLRRTVATQLAATLGDEGDKLVKRVMGHSDGGVTKIYNRYGYVREMRLWLTKWADELTDPAALHRTLSSAGVVTPAKSRGVSPSRITPTIRDLAI